MVVGIGGMMFTNKRYVCIPPGSLTLPRKISHPKREVIFQPSFFRGELLNFLGVYIYIYNIYMYIYNIYSLQNRLWENDSLHMKIPDLEMGHRTSPQFLVLAFWEP